MIKCQTWTSRHRIQRAAGSKKFGWQLEGTWEFHVNSGPVTGEVYFNNSCRTLWKKRFSLYTLNSSDSFDRKERFGICQKGYLILIRSVFEHTSIYRQFWVTHTTVPEKLSIKFKLNLQFTEMEWMLSKQIEKMEKCSALKCIELLAIFSAVPVIIKLVRFSTPFSYC